MSSVAIRRAAESDIPAIARLQELWCNEEITWGFVPDTLEGIAGHIRPYCFVAESRGELVGFVTGQVLTDPGLAALPHGAPCLEIADLYVVREHRCSGIGGRLLESLIDTARAGGIESFRLHSGTKDIRSVIAFYERHGFQTVGVTMVRKP